MPLLHSHPSYFSLGIIRCTVCSFYASSTQENKNIHLSTPFYQPLPHLGVCPGRRIWDLSQLALHATRSYKRQESSCSLTCQKGNQTFQRRHSKVGGTGKTQAKETQITNQTLASTNALCMTVHLTIIIISKPELMILNVCFGRNTFVCPGARGCFPPPQKNKFKALWKVCS